MPFSKLSLASVIMAVGAFLAGAGTAHAQVSISKVEVIPQRIVLDHKGEGYAQIVMTGANIGPAGCGIEIDYGGGAASDYLIYGDALLSFGLFSRKSIDMSVMMSVT